MTCTSPVTLKMATYSKMLVPCGRCLSCRIQKSKEWAVRIMHETDYHEGSSFITLTYDSDFLPENMSVEKEEFQKFMKRLRKAVYPKKIKYYACGEYGEQFGRPHYHAILFGLPCNKETEELIKDVWNRGRIDVGTVTFDSARYVANYIQKKWYGDASLSRFPDRAQPFQLQSQGLGKSFALDNKVSIDRDLKITMRGENVGIPRYYKKVLEIDPERLREKTEEHRRYVYDHYLKKGLYGKALLNEGIMPARMQADRNARARINLRKNTGL